MISTCIDRAALIIDIGDYHYVTSRSDGALNVLEAGSYTLHPVSHPTFLIYTCEPSCYRVAVEIWGQDQSREWRGKISRALALATRAGRFVAFSVLTCA